MLPALFLCRDQWHFDRFPGRDGFIRFDDEGRYVINHVPPGRWNLVLTTCWESHEVATVDLKEGETTEQPLDLTALAAGELQGRVLWNDRPLDTATRGEEQLRIRVLRPSKWGQREFWSALSTDAAGNYRWRGPAGTATLHKGRLCAPQSVAIRPGEQAVQDFHGASSVLRLRIVDTAGTPVAGVTVDLLDLDGKQVASLPPTGADGRSEREVMLATYRVEALPQRRAAHAPGALGPDTGVYLGDVTVAPGQSGESTLRLPPH